MGLSLAGQQGLPVYGAVALEHQCGAEHEVSVLALSSQKPGRYPVLRAEAVYIQARSQDRHFIGDAGVGISEGLMP